MKLSFFQLLFLLIFSFLLFSLNVNRVNKFVNSSIKNLKKRSSTWK